MAAGLLLAAGDEPPGAAGLCALPALPRTAALLLGPGRQRQPPAMAGPAGRSCLAAGRAAAHAGARMPCRCLPAWWRPPVVALEMQHVAALRPRALPLRLFAGADDRLEDIAWLRARPLCPCSIT
jgi:hypothetical protein